MYNDILTSLKSLFYSGDRKNFTFDKYCTAHIEQHNRHASLAEYNVPAIEESMKIHYFKEGIKYPSLESARNAILVNRANFPDFDSVMQLYVTSKRGQKSSDTAPQGRNLSAMSGRGGTYQGRGGADRGGHGRGDPGARQRGLISQADIDRVTDIEKKHYPNKMQLMNLGKERGVGPTGGKKPDRTSTNVSEFAAAVSSAVSAISALTDAKTKRTPAEEASDDDMDTASRSNPALARQSKKSKNDKCPPAFCIFAFRTVRLANDHQRYITDLVLN
jgi:hypothetical protein